MILKYVTIAGVDDNCNIKDLIELSYEFPMVEWGILLSSKSISASCYPSAEWIREYYASIMGLSSIRINTSWHLCGELCRNFIMGDVKFLNQFKLPFFELNDRVQLNFDFNHINNKLTMDQYEFHWKRFCNGMYKNGVITQYNNSNKNIWKMIHNRQDLFQFNQMNYHHILFDSSLGNGKSPISWQKPIAGFFCGYAGGISDLNIEESLSSIENIIGDGICWVDMQSGVRDENNKLDLNKVAKVLKVCKLKRQKDFNKEGVINNVV